MPSLNEAVQAEREREAFELGVSHAKSAASWVLDGNHTEDHYRWILDRMDSGEDMDTHLPAMPDLSGQWADDMTPDRLYGEIIGYDAHLATVDPNGSVTRGLCDAYERGVSETFLPECERLVRSALES